MKELKIGEVFMFLGTQYIVCGYNAVEGVIQSIDIWPFLGDPETAALGCPMAEPTCPMEQALRDLKNALGTLKKVS